MDLEYFRTLFAESDRGCVLLAVSKLDEMLKELHSAHINFTGNPPAKIIETLFEWPGPLSNFAGKTQLAYAYGLIDAGTFRGLERLRKIRNLAAHSSSEFDFLSSSLSEAVLAIGNESDSLQVAVKNLTRTEIKAAQSLSSKEAMKQCFLTTTMALGLEILQKHSAVLQREIERAKADAKQTG